MRIAFIDGFRSIAATTAGFLLLSFIAEGAPLALAQPSTPVVRRRRKPQLSGSIAAGNRWGGEHQHGREIARRRRQAGAR